MSAPTTQAPREPLAAAEDTVVACQACELDFDDFTDAAEAQHFAVLHNDLHGHGRVTGAHAVHITVDVDEDGW